MDEMELSVMPTEIIDRLVMTPSSLQNTPAPCNCREDTKSWRPEGYGKEDPAYQARRALRSNGIAGHGGAG
jgi:hypothetical protein